MRASLLGSCMFWGSFLVLLRYSMRGRGVSSLCLACRLVPGLRLDLSVFFGSLLTSVSKVTTFRLSKESQFYFLNAQQ